MTNEQRLLAEQRKLDAVRARIVATTYLKAAEVRRHLHVGRATLEAVPAEVLPWTPGAGKSRVERRYHPSDVAAYPARARRWRAGIDADREAETLAAMRAEMDERDTALIAAALAPIVA